MKKTFFSLLSAFATFGAVVTAPSSSAFYSNTGVEARVTFHHTLVLSGSQPGDADAQWEVGQLLYYLSGPLQKTDPVGGPKFDQKIQIQSITPVPASGPDQGEKWAVQFSATLDFVLSKDNPKGLKLYLPVDRRTIFQKSVVASETSPANRFPCIEDVRHTEEKYFWYFWDPSRQGCPLQEGVDYVEIVPDSIQVLPGTDGLTLPRYPELRDPNGVINMLVIFGADQDELGNLSPNSDNKDYNIRSYLFMKNQLLDAGFKSRTITNQELSTECGEPVSTTQTIEEYSYQALNAQIKVRLLWGTTSDGPQSLPYYCLLNSALSDASVILYNAHSGMGASAYLPGLREEYHLPFKLSPDQYQLMAFNGCSSYGYYNQDLFNEKITPGDPNGQRMLNIITNGIAGNFYDLGKMSWSVVQAVLDWADKAVSTPYRDIIGRMDTPYLTAVIGDDDNPRTQR